MFVAKLDTIGKVISYFTISGNGIDTITDMALDSSGSIYLAGSTSSTSFPLVHALQSTVGAGFLVKLDAAANQIVYSTYFPAAINAIAADAGGIYLTGGTDSAAFPVTAGMPARFVGIGTSETYAAFISKISAVGDRLVYIRAGSPDETSLAAAAVAVFSARDIRLALPLPSILRGTYTSPEIRIRPIYP